MLDSLLQRVAHREGRCNGSPGILQFVGIEEPIYMYVMNEEISYQKFAPVEMK